MEDRETCGVSSPLLCCGKMNCHMMAPGNLWRRLKSNGSGWSMIDGECMGSGSLTEGGGRKAEGRRLRVEGEVKIRTSSWYISSERKSRTAWFAACRRLNRSSSSVALRDAN